MDRSSIDSIYIDEKINEKCLQPTHCAMSSRAIRLDKSIQILYVFYNAISTDVYLFNKYVKNAKL